MGGCPLLSSVLTVASPVSLRYSVPQPGRPMPALSVTLNQGPGYPRDDTRQQAVLSRTGSSRCCRFFRVKGM